VGETGSGNICTESVCPSLLLTLHLEFLLSHPHMALAIACILDSRHIQLLFQEVNFKRRAIRKTHLPFPPVVLHTQPPTDFAATEEPLRYPFIFITDIIMLPAPADVNIKRGGVRKTHLSCLPVTLHELSETVTTFTLSLHGLPRDVFTSLYEAVRQMYAHTTLQRRNIKVLKTEEQLSSRREWVSKQRVTQ